MEISTPKPIGSPLLATSKPARVWTTYLFFLLTLIAMLLTSALALLISFGLEHGFEEMPKTQSLLYYATKPHVLVISMWTTALTLSAMSFGAAKLSALPIREALGLRNKKISWSTLLIVALGAPALGTVLETIVLALGIEASGTLKLISDSLRQAKGLELPLFVAAITLGPAFGEELVFRGFIQQRLIARQGPLIGIAISSTLFGLLHLDALQSPLAGILGLYIGLVAYRLGSIWPAILTHAFNNFFSIVTLIIFSGETQDPKPDFLVATLALFLFAVSLRHLLRTKKPRAPLPNVFQKSFR